MTTCAPWVEQFLAPSAELCNRILSCSLKSAKSMGISVHVAVVDSAGSLCGYIRMGNAHACSKTIAMDKAYTAACFSMTSREFGALLASSAPSLQRGMLERDRLTEIPGGVPIILHAQNLGGIGVSGGSEEQDETIARTAMESCFAFMAQAESTSSKQDLVTG